MNREELERYMEETYSAGAEYLWAKYPDYAVFRLTAPKGRKRKEGIGT